MVTNIISNSFEIEMVRQIPEKNYLLFRNLCLKLKFIGMHFSAF